MLFTNAVFRSIWAYAIFSFLFSVHAHAEIEKIEKAFSVAPGGRLIVESSSGSIKVETWKKDEVNVLVSKRGANKEKLQDFRVSIEKQGNNVSVEGVGNSGGWGNWGSKVSVSYKIQVPYQYDLSLETGGGSIDVAKLKGKIKARTSGGSISVGDVEGDIDVDTSGGKITVGNISGTAKVSTSGGSIRVESAGKLVDANTSGGSIRIGPSDGAVRADTSGGSITIGHAKGDISADTSGGSIRVEGSDGNVKADTSGGGIDIDNVAGYIVADTSGGGINITRAQGKVKADTSGGEIRVELVEDNPKVDTSMTLDTSGGPITVYLPEKLKATISASLGLNYRNKESQIYSDFPLTIKKSDNEVLAAGDINGGGDGIRLRTNNSDIYIRKLEK